jgi:hypothetical protein
MVVDCWGMSIAILAIQFVCLISNPDTRATNAEIHERLMPCGFLANTQVPAKSEERNGYQGCPTAFFSILAHVSFSGRVRLNTSLPAVESGSTQK